MSKLISSFSGSMFPGGKLCRRPFAFLPAVLFRGRFMGKYKAEVMTSRLGRWRKFSAHMWGRQQFERFASPQIHVLVLSILVCLRQALFELGLESSNKDDWALVISGGKVEKWKSNSPAAAEGGPNKSSKIASANGSSLTFRFVYEPGHYFVQVSRRLIMASLTGSSARCL